MSDKVVFYAPFENDTKIAGLYDLGHTIGRGHYAVVKLARHVFTGEKVAVKVIDKTKLDSIAQDHLFQEVVCMKLVQHPNVIRLYEVIDTPAKLYLILELGDGGDLYDYITRHGCGLHENIAKRYFRQIVTAIAYCHKLHVVHRDLKPENVVFFEKLGLVKLTDFGFSNRFTPGRHLDTACGSLAYSAPEILLGDSYDAPKVDIWSLGVILYMLVCGRLPFEEATDSETVTKIMDCDYVIPDYISSECAQLIARLLVRDPQKRAHLDDILQADWFKQGEEDELPIELFSIPLVSKECLSFKDHMEILSKMSEGQLATVEEIQSTLDRNEYNHIAATYFLLAERKLKRNYIEQYNVLAQQAQITENLRQQQLKQMQVDMVNSAESSKNCQYNEFSGKLVHTPTRLTNTLPTVASQQVEDRIRRFSMILEDEEEEEEEKVRKRSSVLSEINRAFSGPDITIASDAVAMHSSLTEADQMALFEEEEEEFLTVANLASVRCDLSEQSSFPTFFTSREPHFHSARPYSGGSVSIAEVSDEAESDASLSNWSTTVNDPSQSSHARSLPSAEMRRKAYRRLIVPHRPLISVRSSPQLLKHITEEDWDGVADGEQNSLPSAKLQRLFKSSMSPRPSKTVSSEDIGDVVSLRGSLFTQSKFTSFDDQTVRTRSRLSCMGQRAMSNTHSPTRARRLFTSGVSKSRPTSIGSWSAAFNMSLVGDLRRRSLCSSPAENSTETAYQTLVSGHQSQRISSSFRVHDRRCSEPPGLAQSAIGFSLRNHSVASPTHSQTDVLLTKKHIRQVRHRNHSESERSDSDHVEISHDPAISKPFTSTPYLNNVSDSTVPDKSLPNGSSSLFKRHSFITTSNNSPSRNLPSLSKRPLTRSPNRFFNSAQKSIPWSNSTPMLSHNQEVDPLNAYQGPAYVANGQSLVNSCAATLREYCAPIREEDDEIARTTDGATSLPVVDTELRVRRSSESSALHTVAPISGSGVSYSMLENFSPLSSTGLRNAEVEHSYPVACLNSSNFSLTSLASCLRDSRYMLDIIRGTFELKSHYNRRNINSFTFECSSGQQSGHASTSVSVRSLTGLSEYQLANPYSHNSFPDALRRIKQWSVIPTTSSTSYVETNMHSIPVNGHDISHPRTFAKAPIASNLPLTLPHLIIHQTAIDESVPLILDPNASSLQSNTRKSLTYSDAHVHETIPRTLVSIVKFDKHGDLGIVNPRTTDRPNHSNVRMNSLEVTNSNNSNTSDTLAQTEPLIYTESSNRLCSPFRSLHPNSALRAHRPQLSCCAIF